MTNVNEVLARKRVQIVGLDLSLSEELTEIFRNAGAEVITDGSADLIVAPPGAAQHVNPATPHLIIVDSLDAMEQQRRGEHSDFLIAPPLRIDEVLLRAFRLLIGSRRGGSGATPSMMTQPPRPSFARCSRGAE